VVVNHSSLSLSGYLLGYFNDLGIGFTQQEMFPSLLSVHGLVTTAATERAHSPPNHPKRTIPHSEI
jgi:hypothetical protein